jgi:hypothetical protein
MITALHCYVVSPQNRAVMPIGQRGVVHSSHVRGAQNYCVSKQKTATEHTCNFNLSPELITC